MAKITNTSGSSNIWLGSKQNARQTVLYVPGAITANKPGILFLESTDGTTPGGLAIWADQSNSLRYHTSIPSDEDADGTVLGMATSSQASRSLHNLQTTSINANLGFDTDSTYTIGATNYLLGVYTDVLYLTSTSYITGGANDMTVTGDVSLSEGMINIDTTTDETSYIKRNKDNATNAVFEIEDTHTGGDAVALLVDQNGTANSTAVQINHDGDYPTLELIAGAARTGNVIDIAMANQEAEIAINIDGAATGTSGEGMVWVNTSGAQDGDCFRADTAGANAATSALFKGIAAGNQAAATNGITAYFTDTGSAAATSYTVYIASTSNEALFVDTGKVVFDEDLTMTGGANIAIAEGKLTVDSTVNESSYFIRNQGTTTAPVVEIEITSVDDDYPALLIDSKSDGDADAVVIETDGTGYGISIQPSVAGGGGLEYVAAAANVTASGIILNGTGTPGPWIGAQNVGFLQIQTDGQLAHADCGDILVAHTGAAKASARGFALRMVDTGTGATAGTAYVAYIASTNNEALYVDTGYVKVDEYVEAAGHPLTATARAATVAGATTGTILTGEGFITVTASDTNAIIILPTPTPGHVVWLASPTDDSYELRSSAPNTVYINGGNGTVAESAVANADMLTRCVCVDATHWTVTHFALNGTESAGDAAGN